MAISNYALQRTGTHKVLARDRRVGQFALAARLTSQQPAAERGLLDPNFHGCCRSRGSGVTSPYGTRNS
jgi:hypothetical protein